MSTLKDRVFLDIANRLGQLGTCDRARVGAVIVKHGRCISWGYNGALAGQPHCEENIHGWWDLSEVYLGSMAPERLDVWRTRANTQVTEFGCKNVIHAEANAIAFAARQGISTEGCTLYVERSPCLHCSRLIIAAGIECVVTAIIYRDPEGWNLLDKAGVERRFIDAADH